MRSSPPPPERARGTSRIRRGWISQPRCYCLLFLPREHATRGARVGPPFVPTGVIRARPLGVPVTRCAARRPSEPLADRVRALADVVEPRQREATRARRRARTAASSGSGSRPGAVVAAGLGDQAALGEAGDGRVGRDAADPRDLRPRDRAEVGDDRERLERRLREPALDRPLEEARARVRRLARGAERPAAGDLLEDDAAPALAVALPEEAERGLDALRRRPRRPRTAPPPTAARRDDEQRLERARERSTGWRRSGGVDGPCSCSFRRRRGKSLSARTARPGGCRSRPPCAARAGRGTRRPDLDARQRRRPPGRSRSARRRREQRAEALDELRDGREPQRHVRERRPRRLDGERAQRRGEPLRLLRREPPLGPRRERRRAEPEEPVALSARAARRATPRPPSSAGTRRAAARAPRRPPPARARRARRPPPGRARAPSARAARRRGRGTRRTRRGRARRARRARSTNATTIPATSTSARSSSSRRTSVSSRSNGPSKASRSSSSSRTTTGAR